MKKITLAVFLLLFVKTFCFAGDYYVREDGTAANKEAATSPDNANTSMSLATFEGESFSDGDFIYFAGTFNLETFTEDIDIPSGGSAWGSATQITYASYSGNPAILDGGGKDIQSDLLIDTNGQDYIIIDGFTFTNVYSASGNGEALNISGSEIKVQNCIFTAWNTTSFAGDGAWIEVGGNGSDPDINQYIIDCSFTYTDGEHISSHSADGYNLYISGCNFDSSDMDTGTQGTNLAFDSTTTTAPTELIIDNCILNACGVDSGEATSAFIKRSLIKNQYGASYPDHRFQGIIDVIGCVVIPIQYRLFDMVGGIEMNFINTTFYSSGFLDNSRFIASVSGVNTINITNCIFHNLDEPVWSYVGDETINITNSRSYALNNWYKDNTPTVNTTNVTSGDCGLSDPDNDDFTLINSSYCINTGSNTVLSGSDEIYSYNDILRYNGTSIVTPGGTVDIGACEFRINSGGVKSIRSLAIEY